MLKAKKSKKAKSRYGERLAPMTRDEAEAIFIARLTRSAALLNWTQSAVGGLPIGRDGEPCPWYTYPALHFLNTRDLAGLNVFEYGSGNSTLWWSASARTVTSVEHTLRWYEKMKPMAPANVTYVYRELVYGGDYGREILRHDTDFDIVVIDGRDRVNCARACIEKLADRAVVIWDNSNRAAYDEGYALLTAHGYRRLDFFGHGPVNAKPWMTSIFYKPGNCLDI